VRSIEPRAAQLTDGYRWYDIARWVPESGQYVWIGPGRPPGDGRGPAIEAVYVDRCEIAP